MARGPFLLFSFGLVSLFPLMACGSDSSGATTGKRIVLHTSATAEAATKATFTTGFGWDVTLGKAAVAVSGLYYFDGPPPTAMRARPGARERLAGLFIGTAWAHPGHYQAGTALGQVTLTAPSTIDLFAPSPTALADGEGVTGIYRSARFVLAAVAPTDPLLDGHVAVLEGRATKHDGTSPAPIFFRLVADYADISGSINNGAVDGCVLEEATVTESGSIAVEIKPSVWVNLVDFSKIEAGTATNPTEARSSGFSQGVTQLSAYRFSYTK